MATPGVYYSPPERVPVSTRACSLHSPLHSGCLEGRPRPQCTSKLRMGRRSYHSCTLPSLILAGSHLGRAQLSWASSRSRFSEMEQLLASPKVVFSLRMPFSHPSSPYSLSLRCVSKAWAMKGAVGSSEGNEHSSRGGRFPLLFNLGRWFLRFRTLEDLEASPCPDDSAHPFLFTAPEPYCKCGSWLILPGTPTVQRPAGL